MAYRDAPGLGLLGARPEAPQCCLCFDGDAMLNGARTQFTSEEPAELAKAFSLKPDAKLHKETAGHMVSGRYEVYTFSNVHEFVGVLSNVTTSQAISSSTPGDELPKSGRIASRKHLAKHTGAIA